MRNHGASGIIYVLVGAQFGKKRRLTLGVSRRAFLRGAGVGAVAAAAGASAAAAVTLPQAATKTAAADVHKRANPEIAPDYELIKTEALVVGAGAGGVAAAIALVRAGRKVVLTEPTHWVGGQLTSQAVPLDDHAWVDEGLGSTRTYRELREDVRQHFKLYYPLTDEARAKDKIDPGNGWAHLSAEPAIWEQALRAALDPYIATERLRLLLNTEPTAAVMVEGAVREVSFRTPDGDVKVLPDYVIESSELGDLLPLAGIPHVVGREQGGPVERGGTGELHNQWAEPDPECQQAFTVVAALGFARDRPSQPVTTDAYEKYAELYASFGANGKDIFDPTRDWPWAEAVNFWQYRRVRYSGHLTDPGLGEITLLNQPQNDHRDSLLIPASGPNDPEQFKAAVSSATEQTIGLVQFFQTAYRAPGRDKPGVDGLFLVPQAAGTETGIAAYPYVRESRRIKAVQTIYEWHIGVEDRARTSPGANSAVAFDDSVGTGAGPVDIHPTKAYPSGVFFEAYPFQIPFRALVPRRTTNVLAGGKTLGTTHITNGAYRYHPNEWSVGEAAGHAIAFVLQRGIPLRQLIESEGSWRDFATYLEGHGIKRAWPEELRGEAVARLGG